MPEETKAEKFRRIGQDRTVSVMDRLRVLGNLSDRNNYDYSDAEVGEMFSAIRAAVDEAEAKFKADTKPVFSFTVKQAPTALPQEAEQPPQVEIPV